MIIDHVDDDSDLPHMALFNELLELLWRAIFRFDGKELHGIVAPIVIVRDVVGKQWILSYRQYLHRIDAESLQVVQFVDSAYERLIERTDVHLVDDHSIESRLGERRDTEARVHDDGLRRIVIARQAKTVGQLKSG